MEQETNKTEVATITDLISFKDISELRAYSDEIAKSKLTPLKTGADVMVAILTGKELGFGSMFSVNNIYPINGRGTLGVHAINAKLLQAGIVVEVLKDFEPCVNFVLKGDDDKPVLIDKNTGKEVFRDDKGNAPKDSVPSIIREGFADESPKSHEIKGKKITNYKTVIKFTRKLKQIDGSYREMVAFGEFSTQEALTADLAGKDNWTKYAKTMVYTRAYTFGARKIADDIIGGLPESTEYADVKNIKYSIKEQGSFAIIQDENVSSINTDQVSEATVVDEVENDPSKKR